MLQMALGAGLATTIAEDEKKKRERNIIEIPDNATNGEVIKQMFPNYKEVFAKGDIIILERFTPYCKMQFHKDWWNAPYKTERGEK